MDKVIAFLVVLCLFVLCVKPSKKLQEAQRPSLPRVGYTIYSDPRTGRIVKEVRNQDVEWQKPPSQGPERVLSRRRVFRTPLYASAEWHTPAPSYPSGLAFPSNQIIMLGGCVHPVRGGGVRITTRPGHVAADIFAPEGTDVLAPWNGVVVWMEPFTGRGSDSHIRAGRYLVLDHGVIGEVPHQGRRLYTRSLHLFQGEGPLPRMSWEAGLGSSVKAGELIARVGRTGIQESEAHLHFEVIVADGFRRGDFFNETRLMPDTICPAIQIARR